MKRGRPTVLLPPPLCRPVTPVVPTLCPDALNVAPDWLEHVLATDGVPYLKTPEHEMWWWERYLVDAALLMVLFAAAAWYGLRMAAWALGLGWVWSQLTNGLFTVLPMDLPWLLLRTMGLSGGLRQQDLAGPHGEEAKLIAVMHKGPHECLDRTSSCGTSSDCSSRTSAQGGLLLWLTGFGASSKIGP